MGGAESEDTLMGFHITGGHEKGTDLPGIDLPHILGKQCKFHLTLSGMFFKWGELT